MPRTGMEQDVLIRKLRPQDLPEIRGKLDINRSPMP